MPRLAWRFRQRHAGGKVLSLGCPGRCQPLHRRLSGWARPYRLACDTTIFAAIGPDSATELGACPAPAPISVIHIHGTADKNIPYSGGAGQGVAHIDGPAIPALNATWRIADGCAAPAVTTNGPAPSLPLSSSGSCTPTRHRPLSTTSVIWQFLAAHHK